VLGIEYVVAFMDLLEAEVKAKSGFTLKGNRGWAA
jgi:hypothetical protein